MGDERRGNEWEVPPGSWEPLPPDVGVLSSQSVLMPDLLVNPPTMESLECMNILNL